MTKENSCADDVQSCLSPDLFRALADPNRIAILARLAGSAAEQTVTEVAGCCPVDISVVSRHLRILRDAGVVEADKRGKEVFYRVRISDLVRALRNLADALDACCPDGSCEVRGGGADNDVS